MPTLRFLLPRLWHHLGRRRRQQFGLLFGLVILSAFAEIISLGAVLPFIAVLAAPDMVFQYAIVADLAQSWGITSADQLVLPLTIAFCLAAIFAGAMRILVIWLSTRLTFASGADLSIEVYRRTLYQPYHVHVARSSSEMISGITGKVGHTTLGVMLPLLTLISSSVLLVAIMFAFVVAALVAMSFYLQRGVQGGVKSNADSMGTQFSNNTAWTSTTTSDTTETIDSVQTKQDTKYNQVF